MAKEEQETEATPRATPRTEANVPERVSLSAAERKGAEAIADAIAGGRLEGPEFDGYLQDPHGLGVLVKNISSVVGALSVPTPYGGRETLEVEKIAPDEWEALARRTSGVQLGAPDIIPREIGAKIAEKQDERDARPKLTGAVKQPEPLSDETTMTLSTPTALEHREKINLVGGAIEAVMGAFFRQSASNDPSGQSAALLNRQQPDAGYEEAHARVKEIERYLRQQEEAAAQLERARKAAPPPPPPRSVADNMIPAPDEPIARSHRPSTHPAKYREEPPADDYYYPDDDVPSATRSGKGAGSDLAKPDVVSAVPAFTGDTGTAEPGAGLAGVDASGSTMLERVNIMARTNRAVQEAQQAVDAHPEAADYAPDYLSDLVEQASGAGGGLVPDNDSVPEALRGASIEELRETLDAARKVEEANFLRRQEEAQREIEERKAARQAWEEEQTQLAIQRREEQIQRQKDLKEGGQAAKSAPGYLAEAEEAKTEYLGTLARTDKDAPKVQKKAKARLEKAQAELKTSLDAAAKAGFEPGAGEVINYKRALQTPDTSNLTAGDVKKVRAPVGSKFVETKPKGFMDWLDRQFHPENAGVELAPMDSEEIDRLVRRLTPVELFEMHERGEDAPAGYEWNKPGWFGRMKGDYELVPEGSGETRPEYAGHSSGADVSVERGWTRTVSRSVSADGIETTITSPTALGTAAEIAGVTAHVGGVLIGGGAKLAGGAVVGAGKLMVGTAEVAANLLVGGAIMVVEGTIETAELMARAAEAWRIHREEKKQENEFKRAVTVHEAFERAGIHTTPEMADMLANQLFSRWDTADSIARNLAGLAELGYSRKQIADIAILESAGHSPAEIAMEALAFHDVGVTPEEHIGIAAINAQGNGRSPITPETVRQAQDYVMRYDAPENTRAMANLGVLQQIQQIREHWHPGGNHQTLAQRHASRVPNEDALVNDLVFLRDVLGIAVSDILRLAEAGFAAVDIQIMSDKLGLRRGDFSPSVITEMTGMGREGWKLERQRMKTIVLEERNEREQVDLEAKSRALNQIDALGSAVAQGERQIQEFLNASRGATEPTQWIAALGVVVSEAAGDPAHDRMVAALEQARLALSNANGAAGVASALRDLADASGNPGVRSIVGAVDAVLDGSLDPSEVAEVLEQKREGLQKAKESLAKAREPAQTAVERSKRSAARSRNNLNKRPDLTQSEAEAVTKLDEAGQRAGFITVPAAMVQEHFSSRPNDPDSPMAQATADLTLMTTPRDGASIAAVLAANGSISVSFGRVVPGGAVLTLAELAGDAIAAVETAIGRLDIIATAAERIGYGKPDAALLLGLLHYAGTLRSPEDFSLAGFAESQAGRILRVRQTSFSEDSFMPFDMEKFCRSLNIKPGEAKRIGSFWDLYGHHAGLSTMSLAILGVAGHGVDRFDPRIMQEAIARGRDAIAQAISRERSDPIVAQHVADLRSVDGEMDALRVAYLSRFEPGTPMHMVAGCLMPPEVAELLLRMGTKMLIHLDKTLEAISGDAGHAGVDLAHRVIAVASGAGEIAASLTALRVRTAIWLNVIPPGLNEAELASSITMDMQEHAASGKLEALGRSVSGDPAERRTIQYAMTHLARRVYGGDLSTLHLSEMGGGGTIPWREMREALDTIFRSTAEGSETYVGRIATALAFIDELVADAHLRPPEKWAEELRNHLMPRLSMLVRDVVRPHIEEMLEEYREKGATALRELGPDAVKSEALSIGFSIPDAVQVLFPPEVVARLEGLARRIPQGARAASSVYVQVRTASDAPTIVVVPGIDHLFHGLANDIMGGADNGLHLWPDHNSRPYREARTDLAGWVQTQLGTMAAAYHAGHVLNDAERCADMTAAAAASLARFVDDPRSVITEFYAGIGKPVPRLGGAGWVEEFRDAVLPTLARGAALLGDLPAAVIPEVERVTHLEPGSLAAAAHRDTPVPSTPVPPPGGHGGKPRMGRRKDTPPAPGGGGKGDGGNGDGDKPPSPPSPAESPLEEDGAPPNKNIRVIHITAPHVMSHTGDTDHVWAITHALKSVGFKASFFNRMGMLPKEEELANLRKQKEEHPDEVRILHIQLRPPVQGTYFTPEELAALGDVVITVHEYGTLSDKDRATVDAYAKVADHLIFSSQTDRDLAAASEPSVADKSTIIPISVTLTEGFVGKTVPTDERPLNILHWGSIHHDNGQDHAIALAKAIQQDPELMAKGVKVIIAGTPANASAVKSLLKEAYGLKDDDLKLIGRNQYWRAKEILDALKESGREPILPVEIHLGVENKDIASLFSQARVLYHSSHHGLRPNGTSAITAALHGMGMVAHEGDQTTPEMSAAAQLVHSPEEALAEIKALFNDIEAERALRKKSQAYAATRTPEGAATEYEEIYRGLIRKKRGQQQDSPARRGGHGDDGDDTAPPLPDLPVQPDGGGSGGRGGGDAGGSGGDDHGDGGGDGSGGDDPVPPSRPLDELSSVDWRHLTRDELREMLTLRFHEIIPEDAIDGIVTHIAAYAEQHGGSLETLVFKWGNNNTVIRFSDGTVGKVVLRDPEHDFGSRYFVDFIEAPVVVADTGSPDQPIIFYTEPYVRTEGISLSDYWNLCWALVDEGVGFMVDFVGDKQVGYVTQGEQEVLRVSSRDAVEKQSWMEENIGPHYVGNLLNGYLNNVFRVCVDQSQDEGAQVDLEEARGVLLDAARRWTDLVNTTEILPENREAMATAFARALAHLEDAAHPAAEPHTETDIDPALVNALMENDPERFNPAFDNAFGTSGTEKKSPAQAEPVPTPKGEDANARIWSDLGIVPPRVEVAGNVYIHPNGIPAIVPAADQDPNLVFTPAQLADEPEKVVARIREALGGKPIDMGAIEGPLFMGMLRVRELVVVEAVYRHLQDDALARGVTPHPLFTQYEDFGGLWAKAYNILTGEERGGFRAGAPILEILLDAGVDRATIIAVAEKSMDSARKQIKTYLRAELERMYGHHSAIVLQDELLTHIADGFLRNPSKYRVTEDEAARTLLPVFQISGNAEGLLRHLQQMAGVSGKSNDQIATLDREVDGIASVTTSAFEQVAANVPNAYRDLVSGVRIIVAPEYGGEEGISSISTLDPHWAKRVDQNIRLIHGAWGIRTGDKEIHVVFKADAVMPARNENDRLGTIAEEIWHQIDLRNNLSKDSGVRNALRALADALMLDTKTINTAATGGNSILGAMASAFQDVGIDYPQAHASTELGQNVRMVESFAKIPATLMRDTGEVDPEKIRTALTPLIRAEGPLTAGHVEALVNVYSGRAVGKDQSPPVPKDGEAKTWEEKIRKERDNKPPPGKGAERGGS